MQVVIPFCSLLLSLVSLVDTAAGEEPERTVDINELRTYVANGEGAATEGLVNFAMGAYSYDGRDEITLSFWKNNTPYCLVDPGVGSSAASSREIAQIARCSANDSRQRWKIANGVMRTRFSLVRPRNPSLERTWSKGKFKSVLTGRCLYFSRYNSASQRLEADIYPDGYRAFGPIYLAPCRDSIDPEGPDMDSVTIDPYDNLGREYIYPSFGNLNDSNTWSCPENTTQTIMVPETRSNPYTTFTEALWGCALWQFDWESTGSRIAFALPSPRLEWIMAIADAQKCFCDKDEAWRAAKCAYQNAKKALDAYNFCKSVPLVNIGSDIVTGALADTINKCNELRKADQPVVPADPGSAKDIDYSNCTAAVTALGFIQANGVRPCPTIDPQAPVTC
ncbi:hypothetical protein Dda_5452 [Drechslerella dactyloides]|uniref:Secreted protein n=1 Tax=Drechslerella dactyloides TaxID=74499 RepID=A0AAD6NIV2_DREDA|nr:hypothetical protein Dda_5452 [Drechslerella dactyloides]